MNKKTGTELHAAIDALRSCIESFTHHQADHETTLAAARDALAGDKLAALTMIADDIECDGMGGPFASHLSYLISQERDDARKLFFSRLLGNVKKFNEEYAR